MSACSVKYKQQDLDTTCYLNYNNMKFIKREDAAYWSVLVAIILLLYFVFSDGQFSLIFTLSGTVQTFGFALIVLKIRKSRSVTGLSRQTFICYTVVFGLRFILFLFFRVPAQIFRDTYPMIQPAILFLKPSSLLPLSSQPTYCIASLFCLKPATIKISTQSNPTTLQVWLQSWHYFSIHLSIDLSLEITLGLSHSIFKPLPF